MLEVLGHFTFEIGLAAAGLALLAAGLGVLIAQPSFLAESIPFAGKLISSARIGIGAVLVGAGCFALGVAAGYYHRGTLDQSAALEDQLKAQAKLKEIAESRSKAFAEARQIAEKKADELAARIVTLESMARDDDEKSLVHDSDSCLAADSVQRLNALGRGKVRH